MVPQPVPLAGQLRLLFLARGHRLDLFELEAEQIELSVPRPRGADKLGGPLLQRTHALVRRTDASAKLELTGAAMPVEHVELGAREHQLAVLVLSVEGQQPPAELLEIAHRGRAAAHVCPRAAIGPYAARQHDLLGAVRDLLAGLETGRQSEHALGVGLPRALAHDPSPRAPPEQQIERVREQGLARARLAGEHVQSGREPQLGPFHQQQVLRAQLVEHAACLAPAGDGPDGCQREREAYPTALPVAV